MPKGTSVLNPNLGLIFDKAPIALPPGALSAGFNFRVKEGRLNNLNLGSERFGSFQLGITRSPATFESDPVTLIDSHFTRLGVQTLIFGTSRFLFKYINSTTVTLLNPRYVTGTISVTNGSTSVTGSGTAWLTGLKAGDFIAVGSTTQVDPNFIWHKIASIESDTALTLTSVYTGVTSSGAAYTGLVTFMGGLDDPWDAVSFLHADVDGDDKDLWIATNGIDDIVSWDGNADQVTRETALGFKAKRLAVFKNMLIVMGVTSSGTYHPARMQNSDVGQPLDFVSGLSEIFTLHGGSDEVLAGLPLGDSLVIYSSGRETRRIIVTDFVGDPFVFTFRQTAADVAPLSGRLIADFGDKHHFLGADTAYIFDGVTVQETGGHVFREVLRQRDPGRVERGFSHFDEENGDLLWALPLTSDTTGLGPQVAWTEHYLEDVGVANFFPISSRHFPITATGFYQRQNRLTFDQLAGQWAEYNFRWNDQFFEASFPFNLAGDENGKVYILNTAQKWDTVPLVSYVRFGRQALGDARMRGLLTRVYPFALVFPEQDLSVTARLFDSAHGPLQASATVNFPLDLTGNDDHFVAVYRRGRYFELEFGTAEDPWELAGYDVDIRPGGYR